MATGKVLCKKSTAKILAALLCATASAGASASDVMYWFEGAKLHVRATSALAGKGLVLQTGEDETWTTATNFVAAVPAVGGEYTVDLASLGIANGTPCRIATATVYERLDMLQMTTTGCWIDTGFKGTEVYGVRFGYYTTGLNKKSGDWCGAIGCGKDNGSGYLDARGGFLVASNNKEDDLGSTVWMYRGYYNSNNKPSAKTDSINEYAFTNGVFTLNGTRIANNLNNQAKPNYPNAVSTNETYNINIGRSPNAATGMAFGWWSHVSFDDADGNKILDYVPVRRGDGKVGFWDYATDSFVTSGGNGEFTAGDSKGEFFFDGIADVSGTIAPDRILTVDAEGSPVTISVPSGLAGEQLIIAWDSADKGESLADWAHSAVIAESATAGDLTQKLGKLGLKNGDIFRIFAANVYKPLDMLQMTSKQMYINTGIKDIDVYGIRFGYYATSTTANFGGAIGTGEGTDWGGGFIVGANSSLIDSWYWAYQGTKYSGTSRPNVSTNYINEATFTNRMFTVSSVDPDVADFKRTGLPAGAVAKVTETYSGANILIGRSAKSSDFMYGWWSHVSFDDQDGRKILDYIPVQRVADGKVGFYDRATLSFVTSTGTGDFTAGTVTDDTPVVAVNAVSDALTVTGIPGFIIIFQ